jgi:uncharacterized protein (UPF0548 family)
MRFIVGKWNLENEKTKSRWNTKKLSAGPDFKNRGNHDRYILELPQPIGWTPEKLFNWATDEVLQFKIFPPNRMRAFVDSPNNHVAPGVTILQGVYFGPFRLEMADRVIEVLKGKNDKEQWAGFTYATLEGHAEQGLETFLISWNKATSKVFFSMEAWSRPGLWLTRLFTPLARRVQKKATREVLEFMESKLKNISDNSGLIK